jgi:CheY-like chemotaxis protein
MQGDRSLDRSQDGLGIGLTIVKNLVEMHGGSVQASSAGVGKGSEFLIELPRAAAPAVSRLRMSSLTNHSVRRRRVLIVEDNADCAESLRAVLATDGHEVRVVDEGAKALETLEGFAAEVVLLDVGLPRMDGFMVAHAIRARYEKQAMRPRIIALTGYAKLEDRQAALRSGFDDHVSKPLDPRRLSSLVSEESRPAREEATQRG